MPHASHCLAGTLARCAAPYTTDTGHWLVRLDLRQTDPKAGRIVALRDFGAGDAAAIAAHSLARRMAAGQQVRVYGTTLRAQPCEVILLTGVDVIEPTARDTTATPRRPAAPTTTVPEPTT